MVVCDAARAVLVAAMVLPHLPLGALVALLFAATMFAPPFESARASITPDILQGERYVLGTAVLQTTFLAGEVARRGRRGSGGGLHRRAALAGRRRRHVRAVRLVHRLGTRPRPAAAKPETVQPSPLARMRGGFRLVFGDPALRTLLLLGWLVVFYTIPAGIAAPYAARLGGGPIATGLVIASTALEHDDRDPVVHPVRPAAAADRPDGGRWPC